MMAADNVQHPAAPQNPDVDNICRSYLQLICQQPIRTHSDRRKKITRSPQQHIFYRTPLFVTNSVLKTHTRAFLSKRNYQIKTQLHQLAAT